MKRKPSADDIYQLIVYLVAVIAIAGVVIVAFLTILLD